MVTVHAECERACVCRVVRMCARVCVRAQLLHVSNVASVAAAVYVFSCKCGKKFLDTKVYNKHAKICKKDQ